MKIRDIAFFTRFTSLADQNTQDNYYCSKAKEKSKECDQLKGQEKNTCLEESNNLQQKCIEAIRNERKSTDEMRIRNDDPQIMQGTI